MRLPTSTERLPVEYCSQCQRDMPRTDPVWHQGSRYYTFVCPGGHMLVFARYTDGKMSYKMVLNIPSYVESEWMRSETHRLEYLERLERDRQP